MPVTDIGSLTLENVQYPKKGSNMKKTSKYVDVYNPNKQVQVTVTNSPKYEDDEFVDYDHTVTIKIRAGRDKNKLEFKEDDAIAKFVETIEFEDPQQELDLKKK